MIDVANTLLYGSRYGILPGALVAAKKKSPSGIRGLLNHSICDDEVDDEVVGKKIF